MRYIVHFDKHTSYGIKQGVYFVSYKDKLSDNYSENPIDAKKYKTLGSAITRLGLNVGKIDSVERYVKGKINLKDKSTQRIMKIRSISDEDISIKDVIKLRSSRIEKIDDNGNVFNCDDEVEKYIVNEISKNRERNKKRINKLDYNPQYTSEEPIESSFWDEWISEK